MAKDVAWYIFGDPQPSTAAAGFDGSHDDPCQHQEEFNERFSSFES